jgi:hypothetical protein
MLLYHRRSAQRKHLKPLGANYENGTFLYLNSMKNFSLKLITIFLLSCNPYKSPELKEVLKGDCFWDRTGDKEVNSGRNSCYKFSSEGRCFFYYYNFYNHKRTDSVFLYDDGDVIVPDTWTTQGDTSLIIRGIQYNVLDVTMDSVLLVITKTKDTIILRKNCKAFLER